MRSFELFISVNGKPIGSCCIERDEKNVFVLEFAGLDLAATLPPGQECNKQSDSDQRTGKEKFLHLESLLQLLQLLNHGAHPAEIGGIPVSGRILFELFEKLESLFFLSVFKISVSEVQHGIVIPAVFPQREGPVFDCLVPVFAIRMNHCQRIVSPRQMRIRGYLPHEPGGNCCH